MKCLNWKVMAALAAAGVGPYALVPGLAAAAPLLVMAACPVSMLLMMRAMGSLGSGKTRFDANDPKADEVARLRAEVAAVRAERQTGSEAT
ncbi:MAG: DUF2933 domain-containing protein [Actinomycetota bacterium]|nr:DUF2933 domain-containing protein [Actinomycetota bacterium]